MHDEFLTPEAVEYFLLQVATRASEDGRQRSGDEVATNLRSQITGCETEMTTLAEAIGEAGPYSTPCVWHRGKTR
ncbi:MAG: hypothetical protein OEQ13_10310 [Acidobacteriota bacterium]|nr:hypothetical protein [Acidobacteriota bacterium]